MPRLPSPRSSRALRELREWLGREDLALVALAAASLTVFSHLSHYLQRDTWLALVAGREVSDALPHHDQLTVWTSGRQWVDQQWLAHLYLYGLDRLGGLRLLLMAHGLLILATLALVLYLPRRLGASPRATLLLALPALWTLVLAWTIRAQVLVLPLFLVVCFLLIKDVRRPTWRVLWTLPLLVLWANLHGSVLLGALLVGLRGLFAVAPGRLSWHLSWRALLVPAAALAPFCSPYRLELGHYYSRTVFNPSFKTLVSEWQPTSLSLWTLPFFLLLLFLPYLLARTRATPGLTGFDKALLFVCALFGLAAGRNVIWLIFLAPLLAAAPLERMLPPTERQASGGVSPRQRQWTAAAAVLVVCLGALSGLAHSSSWYRRGWPPAAAQAVARVAAADPKAQVLANVEFADWLLWEDPDLRGRLLADDRLELLDPDQILRLYVWSSGYPAWERLEQPGMVSVLRPGEQDVPIAALARARDERVAYRDRRLAVFVKAR